MLARSGPNAPSPLSPWQFLHWVALPSHSVLPAAGSGAVSWAMAAVVQRASAPSEMAIFFMDFLPRNGWRRLAQSAGKLSGHMLADHLGENAHLAVSPSIG